MTVALEGEHVDHLTTSTADLKMCLKYLPNDGPLGDVMSGSNVVQEE